MHQMGYYESEGRTFESFRARQFFQQARLADQSAVAIARPANLAGKTVGCAPLPIDQLVMIGGTALAALHDPR